MDALAALAANLTAQLEGIGHEPEAGLYKALARRCGILVKRDIAGYRKQVGRMMEDARRTKANVGVNPLFLPTSTTWETQLLIRESALGTPRPPAKGGDA
ncbi:hypothetical protein IMZ48_47380, partial [Candidatus Bathyarchaeota archaeon]|nr:hypothetical protein [Candidatus Bathyarchaeota archaeon]